MIKKLFFYAVIIVFNLALVLSAGEFYARTKHGERLSFEAREAAYRRADFELHHSLVPNSKGRSITREWDVKYSINSFGLRDKEYPPQKDKNTFRILILGDSFTEGYGVEDDEVFAELLEKKLDASQKERKYEIINGGVASYSPLLEYLFLVKRGLSLDPDMVILFYDFSDICDDDEYEVLSSFDENTDVPVNCAPVKVVRAYSSNSLERFLIRHSAFYLYLEKKINNELYKIRDPEKYKRTAKHMKKERYIFFREGQEAVTFELWKRNEKYLTMIQKLLAEKGVAFILVSYPYAVEVNGEEWSEGRIHSDFEKDRLYDEPKVVGYLEKFAERTKTPFINLYDDLRLSEKHPLYYPFDGHFTPNGHEVVADSMYKRLIEGGFIE